MNYDSSGLMAQIQALIAAPTTSRTRTNNKHPYFRRPGRGHNHDTCDACHEAGDLLCCDTCSASFHLMCVNPPLDYEQIPAGDWRCHRCQSTQGEGGNEESTVRKAQTTNRRAGKKRTAPPPPVEPPSKKPALNDKCKRINGKDGKVVEKFFNQAVEWARKLNPEQFVLPKYLMEYGASQFPGAARPAVKKGASKANKQVVETENGMVPSPIIVCFVCDISCRRGPMIKCDACSAFFHFECLNPPLTGIPQGRWLCHLHPEPTLEHKRLKSLSLTERVRLYDYAKQPIDPIQVALRFVTKTQRAKYSYFRSKVPIRGKDFTEVPGAIVHCYTEEDDNPSLPEWPKMDEISYFNHDNVIDLEKEDDNIECITKTRTAKSPPLSLSPLDLLAQVAAKELHTSSVPTTAPSPSQSSASIAVLNSCVNNLKASTPANAFNALDKTTSASAKEKEERELLLVAKKANLEKKFEEVKKEKSKSQEEDVLEGLDLDTIMFLAAQKVRELRCTETMESTNNPNNANANSNLSNRNSRSNSLHENETNFMNLNGDNFDIDSPPQLVPTSVHVKEEREKSGSEKQKSFGEDSFMEISDSAAGATGKLEEDKLGLCRDSRIEIPVPYIKLRILNCQKELTFKEGQIMIGRGHVELNLSMYSPCESVTDEHCCIYYDYVGSRWELINYSPNGTIVNKVPYGCDTKSKTSSKAAPLQENLRLATSYMSDIKPKKFNWRESLQSSPSCHCRERSVHQIWESMEGSAYLERGSRIQVGCVRIVVTETGNESKLMPRELYVFNPVSRLPQASVSNGNANDCIQEDLCREDKGDKPNSTRRNGRKASKETDIETDSGEDKESDEDEEKEKADEDLSDSCHASVHPVSKGKSRKRVRSSKCVKVSLQRNQGKFQSGSSRTNSNATTTTGSVGRGGGRGRGRGRGRIASNVNSRKKSVDNPPVTYSSPNSQTTTVPVKKTSTRGRKRKVSIVPIIDVDEVVITTDDNDKDDNENDNHPPPSNNNSIKNNAIKTNTKISNNNIINNNNHNVNVDCKDIKNDKNLKTNANASSKVPVKTEAKSNLIQDKNKTSIAKATTTPVEDVAKGPAPSRDPQNEVEKPEKRLTEREAKIPGKENSVSVVIGDHDYDGPHTNRTIRRQQTTHVNSNTMDTSTKDGEQVSRSSDDKDVSQNSTQLESSRDSS